VTIKQVIECGTVNKFENGVDTESTNNEVCRARIQFNVTRKDEKGEKKGTMEPRVCWPANSRKIADWVWMQQEYC